MSSPPRIITETRGNTVAKQHTQNYVPNEEYDVIYGRGKGIFNKPGNQKLRLIVKSYLSEYLQAKSKRDKGLIINSIVDKVKSQNGGNVQFVKKDKTGAYVIISEDDARDKVAHVMRDTVASVTKDKRHQSPKPPKTVSSLKQAAAKPDTMKNNEFCPIPSRRIRELDESNHLCSDAVDQLLFHSDIPTLPNLNMENETNLDTEISADVFDDDLHDESEPELGYFNTVSFGARRYFDPTGFSDKPHTKHS